MKCNICGTQAGNSNFCPGCGSDMRSSIQNADRTQEITLISAYKSMFKKYADFTGRSGRREYWLAAVANFLIMMVLLFVYVAAMFNMILGSGDTSAELGIMGVASIVILFVYSLIIIVPHLSLSVRRLHDTGRSAWYLLVDAIPMVGGILFFVLMCLDSQPGANKYGPNPKDR